MAIIHKIHSNQSIEEPKNHRNNKNSNKKYNYSNCHNHSLKLNTSYKKIKTISIKF
jgi:hypothetical protein